jgi:hypothetical protein
MKTVCVFCEVGSGFKIVIQMNFCFSGIIRGVQAIHKLLIYLCLILMKTVTWNRYRSWCMCILYYMYYRNKTVSSSVSDVDCYVIIRMLLHAIFHIALVLICRWEVHTHSKLLIIRLRFTQMSDNSDLNMKYEKCCSQLSTYFKRHMEFSKTGESLVCSENTWQFLQTCIITFKNSWTISASSIDE